MGIEDRLRRLEARAEGPPQKFPDWELSDQLAALGHRLQFRVRFAHFNPALRYPATDHELRLMGHIIEHRNEEGFAPELYDPTKYPTRVPAPLEPYVERMAPEQQPQRDLSLYANRHRSREARERQRWEESLEGRHAAAQERVEAARRDLAYRSDVGVRHFGNPPILEEHDERLSRALAELREIEQEIERSGGK
jgi:hypothetical protein